MIPKRGRRTQLGDNLRWRSEVEIIYWAGGARVQSERKRGGLGPSHCCLRTEFPVMILMRYHDKSKLLNPKTCLQVRKHATGPKLGEKEKKKGAQTDANCESSINYQMTA